MSTVQARVQSIDTQNDTKESNTDIDAATTYNTSHNMQQTAHAAHFLVNLT